MKRYKLKKDLPTFNKGDEFHINSLGHLVRDRDDVVAYAARTLSKFPNILEDWFEEIKENARWRGDNEDRYWWLDITYDKAYKSAENRDTIDENRYKVGNYFKTEQEAEDYGRYLIALQTIKDDAKGFKPDWKNFDQVKYEAYYDHEEKMIDCTEATYCQIIGAICFETEEDIEESFKKHEKEWLIVLGVEE